MKYKHVNDEEYKGHDISIYAMDDGSFICDIKNYDGELEEGFSNLESQEEAFYCACDYINKLTSGCLE